MSSSLHDTAALPAASASPPRIVPREAVHFDTAPLVRLFADKGESEAEDAVCAVLERISQRLHLLETTYYGREILSLPLLANDIAMLCDQVGLCTVARVSRMVAGCAVGGDTAALGATVARLGRVADRSMAEIWDIRDG